MYVQLGTYSIFDAIDKVVNTALDIGDKYDPGQAVRKIKAKSYGGKSRKQKSITGIIADKVADATGVKSAVKTAKTALIVASIAGLGFAAYKILSKDKNEDDIRNLHNRLKDLSEKARWKPLTKSEMKELNSIAKKLSKRAAKLDKDSMVKEVTKTAAKLAVPV